MSGDRRHGMYALCCPICGQVVDRFGALVLPDDTRILTIDILFAGSDLVELTLRRPSGSVVAVDAHQCYRLPAIDS